MQENTIMLVDRAKSDMSVYENKKSSFRRPRRIMENREKIVRTIRAKIKKVESSNNDEDLIAAYLVASEQLLKDEPSGFSLLESLISKTISDVLQKKVHCRGFDPADIPFIKDLISKKVEGLTQHVDALEMKLSATLSQERAVKKEIGGHLASLIEQLGLEMQPTTAVSTVVLDDGSKAGPKGGGCCGNNSLPRHSTKSIIPVPNDKGRLEGFLSKRSFLPESLSRVPKAGDVKYDCHIIICFFGCCRSGQSSIVTRFRDDHFIYPYTFLMVDDVTCRLQLWDLEDFGSSPVRTQYADIVIITWNLLSNKNTESDVCRLAERIRNNAKGDIVLLGTKVDLIEDREKNYLRGCQLKDKIKATAYLECSAKTGEKIDELLFFAASLYLNSISSSSHRVLINDEAVHALQVRISSLVASLPTPSPAQSTTDMDAISAIPSIASDKKNKGKMKDDDSPGQEEKESGATAALNRSGIFASNTASKQPASRDAEVNISSTLS